MKKDLADLLATRREIETIMYDEGDRFMNELSHWPEILQRWAEYKKAKRKSALKMEEAMDAVNKVLEANEGGKAKAAEVDTVEEEERDNKNKQATDEEVLDVGDKTGFLLRVLDGPITHGEELKSEINGLGEEVFGTIGSELLTEDTASDIEKRALKAIGAKIFDIIFLR
jgi:hypothetical protein